MKIVLIAFNFALIFWIIVLSIIDPLLVSTDKIPYELRVAKKIVGIHTYYRAERKMLLFGLFEFWDPFWVYLEEGEVYSPADWNLDIKRAERYIEEFKELKGPLNGNGTTLPTGFHKIESSVGYRSVNDSTTGSNTPF